MVSSKGRPQSPGRIAQLVLVVLARDRDDVGRLLKLRVQRADVLVDVTFIDDVDVRTLIRTISEANPRWRAPRIHGELLKVGIDMCPATVAKYMVQRRQKPSQTWRTFLANHVGQIVAADFFVVPTATGRLLFVLVMLAHERRRIRHVAVTDHPTAAWTRQQLREAFPWDQAPRFVLRDRDHAFDGWGEHDEGDAN